MKFSLNSNYTKFAQSDDMLIEGVYVDEDEEFIVEKHRLPNSHPFEFRLAIKRTDKTICHSWRLFQDIKNAIVGNNVVAIEVYPKESEVTDTVNMYYLWVFKNEYGPNVSLIPPIKKG